MRHRLSDHDEGVLDALARMCPKPERESHRADERSNLMSVYLRDGWAMASDSYTFVCLPVETDLTGAVSAHDALHGGTVDVDLHPGWDLSTAITPLISPHHGGTLTLSIDAVDRLRPWATRKPDIGSGLVAGRGCVAVTPRGRMEFHPDSGVTWPNWEVLDHGEVYPCLFSLPPLARVTSTLSDTSGGRGLVMCPRERKPVALWPVGDAGERDGEHGWGLVMPLVTAWSPKWDDSTTEMGR